MKSHDHLLDRQYDEENYNCVHFAHEAALDLYGIDRAEALEFFMKPIKEKVFLPSRLKLLNPLPMPKEGCIVAFHSRYRNKPHMWGFFVWGVFCICRNQAFHGCQFKSFKHLDLIV
ncbi:hypothetical protein AYR68_05305 [Acinetobacter baumannii]|nr:hypothetical protein AYR68_05305 [Acinetobacter baumannii]